MNTYKDGFIDGYLTAMKMAIDNIKYNKSMNNKNLDEIIDQLSLLTKMQEGKI